MRMGYGKLLEMIKTLLIVEPLFLGGIERNVKF